jgi:hypothetical protein
MTRICDEACWVATEELFLGQAMVAALQESCVGLYIWAAHRSRRDTYYCPAIEAASGGEDGGSARR